MNKEKFQKVIDYFEELNITIPTDVKNSIEDVFNENDDDFSVECYFADELLNFQQDMTLLNNLEINLDGSSSGYSNATWTYYGDIEISYSESNNIYKDEEKVYEISEDIHTDQLSEVTDPSDWVIIMIETTEWNTKESSELKQNMLLRIFCPYTEDGKKVG